MTLEKFISDITQDHTIEFSKPFSPDGYKMTIFRRTEDDRLYKVQLSVTRELVHFNGYGPIYETITRMISDEMLKPYNHKDGNKELKLVKYVRNFILEHKISCGEAIYQCDELNIEATQFMEGCCDIIGYYESGEE